MTSLAGQAGRAAQAMPTALRVAIGLLFWGTIFLVQKFNRLGPDKALVLLALVGCLVILMRRASIGRALAVSGWARGLGFAVGLLLAVQLGYFGVHLWHPHVADIAEASFAGGRAILRGQNPYVLPLDPNAVGMSEGFRGFKYLPVMGLAYLPLGLPFGARGLVLTNLLLQLAVAAMLWRLARAMAGETAGRLAACLYLSLPLVLLQVAGKVSTDLVAVAPLLLALISFEERPGVAGLCVGLSIAAKLTPGALFVPCLLPAEPAARRWYACGIAIGLLTILPYALWSPTAFLDNIVLFNFLRPDDATSWLSALPAGLGTAARFALVGLLLVVLAVVWRRPLRLVERCGLGALLGLAAILLGPGAHQNYHLWWLPFYCIVLAVALSRRDDDPAVPAPASVAR